MSRRDAMLRPPRLSQIDSSETQVAPVTPRRPSKAPMLSEAPRPSYPSYIEDSDVVTSLADNDSVTNLRARPSYVARGEIATTETRTFLPPSVRYGQPDAYAKTETYAAVGEVEREALLGSTREAPLLPPEEAAPTPHFVDHTLLTPMSMRPPMRSDVRPAMMSMPTPAESWRESPWVVPSTGRARAQVPPPPRDTNLLQTIGIIGTGVLMLVIVFGAVLFARSENEERMPEFTQRVAAMPLPPVAAPVVTTAAPAPTMQVITLPADKPVTPPKAAVPTNAPTPKAKPVAAVRVEPRPVAVAKPAPVAATPKKKSEKSVEDILSELGEEQLRR